MKKQLIRSCGLIALGILGVNAVASPPFSQDASPILAKIAEGPAFSFVYNGKPSRDLLPHWEKKQEVQRLSGNRERRILTFHDPATGLTVTNEITWYADYPAVDWVLRLRNEGNSDSPVIEQIRVMDVSFEPPGVGGILLHQASSSAPGHLTRDYSPSEKVLSPSETVQMRHYEMNGDKHVGGQLPFFDLQWLDGGLIGAIGWSGEWEFQAACDSARNLTLEAGQEGTHLILHPGEAIRTPSILLLSWKGKDRINGHNQFRHLLVEHYLPRINGEVALPPVAATSAYVLIFDAIAARGQNPLETLPSLRQADLRSDKGLPSSGDALNAVSEQSQLDYIEKMPPGIEAYWMDAGWFVGGWPGGAGNLEPDPVKFPHGLKPLGEAAHRKGLKFLLWFEPGRVGPDNEFARQHPDWIIPVPGKTPRGRPLFNYGDPDARRWMTDLLSRDIAEWGIDILRQDNNICPIPYWRAADAPDRQGITENHDIDGLYAMWDELLLEHPQLEIDNANWRVTGPDIEAMKRSIGSLTRSESTSGGLPHPESDQAQTEELSLWIPLSANLLHGMAPYSFLSTATTGVGIGLDLRSSYISQTQLQTSIAEIKALRPFWLGDFYPLSETGFDNAAWCAWQFDRPDLGAGYAVFFRRGESEIASREAMLKAIDPAAQYDVRLSDGTEEKEERRMTGVDLARLAVDIPGKPGVLLVRYRKTTP
jgi:alpha-galactosidase